MGDGWLSWCKSAADLAREATGATEPPSLKSIVVVVSSDAREGGVGTATPERVGVEEEEDEVSREDDDVDVVMEPTPPGALETTGMRVGTVRVSRSRKTVVAPLLPSMALALPLALVSLPELVAAATWQLPGGS